MEALRCSVVQMSAGRNPEQNRATAWKHLHGGPASDLVVLPEIFVARGSGEELAEAAEALDGESCDLLATAARKRACWVAAGVLERDGARIFNTLVVFNREGQLAARYRKVHLFDVVMSDGAQFRESAIFTAGDEPLMVNIDGWRCGLAICYDLRFPELFRRYADYGAQLVLLPSNFTRETGAAHWEPLVRARAIENQCYMVAPNQAGVHPHNRVPSHGHSLVVDPWGAVLADAGEATDNVVSATLEPAAVQRARERLPALKHRRL